MKIAVSEKNEGISGEFILIERKSKDRNRAINIRQRKTFYDPPPNTETRPNQLLVPWINVIKVFLSLKVHPFEERQNAIEKF